MSNNPPKPLDWTAEDSDEDNSEELRRQLGSPSKVKVENDAPAKEKEDAPVASLASRISGLSTSATPFQPSSPSFTPSSAPSSDPKASSSNSVPSSPASKPPAERERERPRPNTGNPLFGKALAGVKSDRTPAPQPPLAPTPGSEVVKEKRDETSASNSGPKKEEKETMTVNLMDDPNDGWGNPVEGGGNGNPTEVLDSSMSDTGSGLISNTFQVEVKLADLQADPDSPLFSAKAFEDLPIHADLMKGIYAAGFKKPSKIQEKALPLLLHNPPRNLIGQSQSGTGKTAAFGLDLLSRVDPSLFTPQAICLAPSRELARQIQEVIEKLGQFTDIKVQLAVPRSWTRRQKVEKHILVGTPGTLVDMLSRGTEIFDPKQIKVFVLDEADEMLALQGLGDQTRRIKRMLPPNVQHVLFSATFNDEVQAFAEEFAPEANKIFLRKEEVTVDAIKQLYMECDDEEGKYAALSALYDSMSIGQSIVFCGRRDTSDRIAERLKSEGHSVASLHGDKVSEERDAILDGFRDGKSKVLITTNVVARGIDIQQVNLVVNYDVPDLGPEGPDIETYIHRIGRTGRFGRKGCAVIFVHDARSRRDVEEIQQKLGKPMRRIDASSKVHIDQLEDALKAAMKGPK